MEHLNRDLGAEHLNNKIAYKNVNICVFIFHGSYSSLVFQPIVNDSDWIDLIEVRNNIAFLPCPIDCLDIQACHCGEMSIYDDYGNATCIANEFISSEMINRVYAWRGESKYWLGFNISPDGVYVEFTHSGIEIIGNYIPILVYYKKPVVIL